MKRLLLFIILCSFVQADYLGSWAIDDYLTVMETLHDTSGDAVAATGAVHCWVYENVDVGQIVDEEMAAFDGITGLYEERFQLTTGTGFEAGKTYTVLIQATADGVSGINTHTFQILAGVDVETVDGTDQTGNDNGADINTIVTGVGNIPQSGGSTSWNSAALAAIEAEAVDALESFNLDELAKEAVTTNLQTAVHDNSILGYMLASANVSAYVRTTDSLEDLGETIALIFIDTDAYDSDAEYATALWNAATNAYGGAGTYGQAVEDWIDGGRLDVILDEILFDTGTSIPAAIGGSGTDSWTYTVTNSVGGAAIPQVLVWVTSDEAGASVAARGYTNEDGDVTFNLTIGNTVYVWKQHPSYTFDNPDTEVVD